LTGAPLSRPYFVSSRLFVSGVGRETFKKFVSFPWEGVRVLRLMARVTAQEATQA
jgi:hypothetical protein